MGAGDRNAGVAGRHSAPQEYGTREGREAGGPSEVPGKVHTKEGAERGRESLERSLAGVPENKAM